MTWLKKIGTVVLKVVGIASGLLPLIAPAVTSTVASGATVVDKLTAAFHAVITAEQMFTAVSGPDAKTGSGKLAAASPFVGALVQEAITLLPNNPKLKDEAALQKAIITITGGLADALNAYGD